MLTFGRVPYALGTCPHFRLDILNINVISGIVYFRKIIWRTRETIEKQPLVCGLAADTVNDSLQKTEAQCSSVKWEACSFLHPE